MGFQQLALQLSFGDTMVLAGAEPRASCQIGRQAQYLWTMSPFTWLLTSILGVAQAGIVQ